jgi:hypothetical protein
MTPFRRLSLSALPVVLAATLPAYAGPLTSVIDFNTLPGSSGSAFTTYSENGYTVSIYSGTVKVYDGDGDPEPSLLSESSNGAINIQVTTGDPDFIFDDVDLATLGAAGTYTITGYLNGSQVFSHSGTIIGGYAFNGYGTGIDTATIDDLHIAFASTSDSDLDNITLTSVPPCRSQAASSCSGPA